MIERMNERITIQRSTVSTDQYGNHKNTWSDCFTCWAYASTFNQDEKESAAVTVDERGITFEIRYCSELASIDSTIYRVKFHNEIYNIESVDMMNWQRKSIKLKCTKNLIQPAAPVTPTTPVTPAEPGTQEPNE